MRAFDDFAKRGRALRGDINCTEATFMTNRPRDLLRRDDNGPPRIELRDGLNDQRVVGICQKSAVIHGRGEPLGRRRQHRQVSLHRQCELWQIEGLLDVIIGARLQRFALVRPFVERGDHHNANLAA